jgi:hypothetical protein
LQVTQYSEPSFANHCSSCFCTQIWPIRDVPENKLK